MREGGKNIIKMKIQLALVILGAIVCTTMSQECLFGKCDNSAAVTPETKKVVEDSELEIRKWFWFYLRGSRLVYSTIIDLPDQILMFFIHRNIVGTFQTVSGFDKAERTQSIKNMVRIGSGASPDVQNLNEAPVDIEPTILSIQLKPQEYLVTLNEAGNFVVLGANLSSPAQPQIKNSQALLPGIDNKIRTQFPQYLTNSTMIFPQTILTTLRVYFLLTYINPQGLFLAIGSDDALGNQQINTFVRLGAGSTKAKPDPITLNAKVIQLT